MQENGAILVTDVRYKSNPFLVKQLNWWKEKTLYDVLVNGDLNSLVSHAFKEGYEHLIVLSPENDIDLQEQTIYRSYDRMFESIRFVEEVGPRVHMREADPAQAQQPGTQQAAQPQPQPAPANSPASLTLFAMNANPPLKGFKNVISSFSGLKLAQGTKLLKVLMPPEANTLGADFRFSILPEFYPDAAKSKAFDEKDWFPLGTDQPIATTIQGILTAMKVANPAAFPIYVGGSQVAAAKLIQALQAGGFALQQGPQVNGSDNVDTTIGPAAVKICDQANITGKKPEEAKKIRDTATKGKAVKIDEKQKLAVKLFLGYWSYANNLIDLKANPRSGKNLAYFKNLLSAEDKAVVDEVSDAIGIKNAVTAAQNIGRLVGLGPNDEKDKDKDKNKKEEDKAPSQDTTISPDGGKHVFDVAAIVLAPEFQSLYSKLDL